MSPHTLPRSPVAAVVTALVVLVLGMLLGACAVPVEESGGPATDALRNRAQTGVVADKKPRAVVTFRTVRSRTPMPFRTRVQRTDSLDLGVREISQRGRPGVEVSVFRLRLRDGVKVARQKVRTFVMRRPETRVVLVGTYVAPPPEPEPQPVAQSSSCDSNYAGGCVPIASDVDCGGGSGNGPAYVYSTVEVVGSDVYGLDADSDGFGCE